MACSYKEIYKMTKNLFFVFFIGVHNWQMAEDSHSANQEFYDFIYIMYSISLYDLWVFPKPKLGCGLQVPDVLAYI